MPRIDRPNTVPVPLQVFDVALRELSPPEFKVLCVAINHTLRWGRKWDWISASQFAEETGLSFNTAAKAARECVQKEWLLRAMRCSLCKNTLDPANVAQSTQECPHCGRRVSIEHLYALNMGWDVLQHLTALFSHNNGEKAGGVQNLNPPPQILGRGAAHDMGRGFHPAEHGGSRGATRELGSPPREMGRHDSGTNMDTNRNVSETPAGPATALSGGPETGGFADAVTPSHAPPKRGRGRETREAAVEAWRRTTEDLARYSARELEDTHSIGFHIQVWNHARKHDRLRGNQYLVDGLFDILRELSERRQTTTPSRPQGSAWTRRTLKHFEDQGVPLNVRTSEPIDEAEREEIRRILANAPFMRAPEE